MFFLKLVACVSLFIVLVECSFETAGISRATPDPKSQPMNVKAQSEELRHLAERSDLIVVGKLRDENLLIDPQKMLAELESAGQKRLPNVQAYVQGKVYNIEVSKTIFRKQIVRRVNRVSVYSLGDPFSLHSRLIRLLPQREYLVFLIRAKKEEVINGPKLLDSKDMSRWTDVKHDDVFLVTDDADGLRLLTDNKNLLVSIEKVAKDLKP